MIAYLANLGRACSTLLLSAAATLAALALALIASNRLIFLGISVDAWSVLVILTPVVLTISLALCWVLLGWLFESRRLKQEMRSIASVDSLTGLPNRHAFFQNAARCVSLARRNNRDFSVMVIDRDHFKATNDNHGHAAGDAVLRLFADVVNSLARRSDIIGRLGGEEFAILLPDTSASEAEGFADRLQKAIAGTVVKTDDALIHYTASIGVGAAIPGCDALEDLLKQADHALYSARRGGRNRTAVHRAAKPAAVSLTRAAG